MKISTLIKQLEKSQAKLGDVEVFVDVDSYHCQVLGMFSSKSKDDNRVVIVLGRTEGIDY